MDEELIKKRSDLKNKIQILEWDKKMGQASFSKQHLLEDYKKQLSEIDLKQDPDG